MLLVSAMPFQDGVKLARAGGKTHCGRYVGNVRYWYYSERHAQEFLLSGELLQGYRSPPDVIYLGVETSAPGRVDGK